MTCAAHTAVGIHVRWRFDLDDIRAPVSELSYCGGSGPDTSQIEHGKP